MSAADPTQPEATAPLQIDGGQDEVDQRQQQLGEAAEEGEDDHQHTSIPTSMNPPVPQSLEPPEDQESPYPSPTHETSLLPPPTFKPFFTLISDPSTGTYHHPTVHYIFADDDPDLLTSACLATLNQTASGTSAAATASTSASLADRFVILDLDATAREVVAASSLSADWQALRTTLTPAPSWGDDGGGEAGRGLMLRIEGEEATARAGEAERGKGGKRERKLPALENVEATLRLVDERLAGLDAVLGGGAAKEASREGPKAV